MDRESSGFVWMQPKGSQNNVVSINLMEDVWNNKDSSESWSPGQTEQLMEMGLRYGTFPLRGTTLFGTACYGTARLSSGRSAFPLQFSTALGWAGLFTCRYSYTASTAVTSS